MPKYVRNNSTFPHMAVILDQFSAYFFFVLHQQTVLIKQRGFHVFG